MCAERGGQALGDGTFHLGGPSAGSPRGFECAGVCPHSGEEGCAHFGVVLTMCVQARTSARSDGTDQDNISSAGRAKTKHAKFDWERHEIHTVLTAHCSLLTAHCSLLTAHCSLTSFPGCHEARIRRLQTRFALCDGNLSKPIGTGVQGLRMLRGACTCLRRPVTTCSTSRLTLSPERSSTPHVVRAHCSLLTAHCSLLTAHCSLLTVGVFIRVGPLDAAGGFWTPRNDDGVLRICQQGCHGVASLGISSKHKDNTPDDNAPTLPVRGVPQAYRRQVDAALENGVPPRVVRP
jgi:hypothetical protein